MQKLAAKHRPAIGFLGASMFKRRSNSNTLPQLGELELSVLKVLWQQPDQAAKSVHQQLTANQKPSLSTVQSTLERLHRKQLLERYKQGHAYVYRARVARSELLGRLIGGVIRQLHTGSLDPILSSFVDFADRMDEQTLDRLEQLIQLRKQQREEGRDD
jgi:predicted transcriptional regulator